MSTSAGAYTYSMVVITTSSKSKVVGISGSEVIELVKRQSFEDTISQDV